jgi:hypothetical protein
MKCLHRLGHLTTLPNGRPKNIGSGVSPYPWRVKERRRSCKAVKGGLLESKKQVSTSAFGLMKAGVVNAKQYGDATGAKTWRKVKRKRASGRGVPVSARYASVSVGCTQAMVNG